MKQVVGLIGGMGSGKSQVAEMFAQRGARVVSGDQLGHMALRQPEIRDQVIGLWGNRLLDDKGDIERRRLGAIVFADPGERQALEALVFPWIEQKIQAEIAAAQTDPRVPLIVLDAAVMLEAGWNRFCDKLVYIYAPRATRLQRLAQQRGWNAKEVEAREHAQVSLTEKADRADYVVDNSGSPLQLAEQVDKLLRQWGMLN